MIAFLLAFGIIAALLVLYPATRFAIGFTLSVLLAGWRISKK